MRALHLLALAALALVPGPVAQAEGRDGYRVIVHPENPATVLERDFVADAFLKKTTRWPSGEVIRPVDQGPEAVVRRPFSEEVLGRSVSAVRSYWQQMIFAGRDLPPAELDSDVQVVAYVTTHPGAIGYVSGRADTGLARVVVLR